MAWAISTDTVSDRAITEDLARRMTFQGQIVRRIYEESRNGAGFSRITKVLNAERLPSPRPQVGHPSGWSPSSVREVLFRRMYCGVIEWNRSRKRNVWGQQQQTPRPASEWVTVDAPQLRIVSDELWAAVHDRLGRISKTLKTAWGGPMARLRDRDSPYLLSSFARCGTCGGAMVPLRRRNYMGLGCLSHSKRGPEVCANGLVLPLQRMDEAVLQVLGADVLNTQVVSAILDVVVESLQPRQLEATIAARRQDLVVLDQTIANLVHAVEHGGGGVTPLVEKLAARQAEREQVAQDIATLDGRLSVVHDRAAIEEKVLAGCRAGANC